MFSHLQGGTVNFTRQVFSVIAMDIYLNFLYRNSSDIYLMIIWRKSFRLSVISSAQLVKLIGSQYACAQRIVSNLSYYWAWLIKLDFFPFSMSVWQDYHPVPLILTILDSSGTIRIYVADQIFCSFIKITYMLFFDFQYYRVGQKFWLCVLRILDSCYFATSLTMKGQNIGSSTRTIYKNIFDSDILDIKKQKYMSSGSFKSHTYCSIAKNGSIVVYQN